MVDCIVISQEIGVTVLGQCPQGDIYIGYEEVTKDLGFAKIRDRYNPGKNKSQIFAHCKTGWYFYEISP